MCNALELLIVPRAVKTEMVGVKKFPDYVNNQVSQDADVCDHTCFRDGSLRICKQSCLRPNPFVPFLQDRLTRITTKAFQSASLSKKHLYEKANSSCDLA